MSFGLIAPKRKSNFNIYRHAANLEVVDEFLVTKEVARKTELGVGEMEHSEELHATLLREFRDISQVTNSFKAMHSIGKKVSFAKTTKYVKQVQSEENSFDLEEKADHSFIFDKENIKKELEDEIQFSAIDDRSAETYKANTSHVGLMDQRSRRHLLIERDHENLFGNDPLRFDDDNSFMKDTDREETD